MQYFHFERLIRKYSSKFKLITYTDSGYNDKGDYVEGTETETELNGAIINFKENVVYNSEGKLTMQDKQLYMLKPLNQSLKGAKVVYDGKIFTIENNEENAKFTGVYAYLLRYVSVVGGNHHD